MGSPWIPRGDLEDPRGPPWEHRGSTVGLPCGWRTSGGADGVTVELPWVPREGPEDPGERPWGHHGSPRGHRWSLDPLAGTSASSLGAPWILAGNWRIPAGAPASTSGAPLAHPGFQGGRRESRRDARRSALGAPWDQLGTGGAPVGAPCEHRGATLSLAGPLVPPGEHLGSTVGLPWTPQGRREDLSGRQWDPSGRQWVHLRSTVGLPWSPGGNMGRPRDHLAIAVVPPGGTVGALCITVQLEDRRGCPWNRRGGVGVNRRIPGSGRGATMDPRGGTAGAWIRSLGPVGTAWEHLGCERGTGGSQWGAREHMRSTVGALWRHWRGARGCAL